MSELHVEERDGCVRFEVRVSPRASRDAVLGVHNGALKVAIAAPPVEGAANIALVAFLAEALGVPKRAIAIVGGERGKTKRVEVEGARASDVRALVT